MPEPTATAPVVLTLFNRMDETLQVLEAIRYAKPAMLFLIADAGRTDEEEVECKATRLGIEAAIDWPCEVFKNYASQNMGARLRLSSGITWVFQHVDRAIILEHDCVPHPDFFVFCTELLEQYQDDERIMHIGGNNFLRPNPSVHDESSYYFSQIPHIWGFATWARAWKQYDVSLSLWPQADAESWLANVFTDPAVQDRWTYRFRQYYAGTIESWDGQWAFACFINNGLCINPRVNLVSNIGFGSHALSTKNPENKFANLPTYPLPFPYLHPNMIIPNRAADAYTFAYVFDINATLQSRIRSFLKFRFPHSYAWMRLLVKGTP